MEAWKAQGEKYKYFARKVNQKYFAFTPKVYSSHINKMIFA